MSLPEKRETARRVRQRISAVMRWAVAQGYREDNPAGDAIGAALPKTGVRTRHQPALPYTEVRGAVERVRASRAYPTTVLTFEFLVLTACRSGEVRGAVGGDGRCGPGMAHSGGTDEDEPGAPGSPLHRGTGGARRSACSRGRLGAGVPVSARPSALRCDDLENGPRPRDRGGAHGFRESFRDWAAECSDAPREVCELALAHVNSDRVEAAYRRTDLFERRRELMEEWAAFLAGIKGERARLAV